MSPRRKAEGFHPAIAAVFEDAARRAGIVVDGNRTIYVSYGEQMDIENTGKN